MIWVTRRLGARNVIQRGSAETIGGWFARVRRRLLQRVGARGEVGVEAAPLFVVERREHAFLDGGDSR